MALSEFELIRRFFTPDSAAGAPQLVCGVGDDCAVLALEPGEQLATSVDTYVSGHHFLESIAPADLAWRCLAAAASDLAGCGARPLGFTLALTLPAADEAWLGAFSEGLARAAGAFSLPLAGGDTTRGPLTLTLQVLGAVPAGGALLRSGAAVGDEVWVTGTLGDARAALDFLQGDRSGGETFLQRYYRPMPRIPFGQALRGVASAAIDISDGLAADLGHILERSGVGAEIRADELPLSAALKAQYEPAIARAYALSGGDDYELCFTSKAQAPTILALARENKIEVTCIGRITAQAGLVCLDGNGSVVQVTESGYQHFGGE